MSNRRRRTAAALFALSIGACSAPPQERAAPAAAPDAGAQLRTAMHELWFYLIALDEALLHPPQPQDVRRTLAELRRVATAIDVDAVRPLHPWFPEQREAFVATIERAQVAVASDPPRYGSTLEVFDGCIRCHDLNDAAGR